MKKSEISLILNHFFFKKKSAFLPLWFGRISVSAMALKPQELSRIFLSKYFFWTSLKEHDGRQNDACACPPGFGHSRSNKQRAKIWSTSAIQITVHPSYGPLAMDYGGCMHQKRATCEKFVSIADSFLFLFIIAEKPASSSLSAVGSQRSVLVNCQKRLLSFVSHFSLA